MPHHFIIIYMHSILFVIHIHLPQSIKPNDEMRRAKIYIYIILVYMLHMWSAE